MGKSQQNMNNQRSNILEDLALCDKHSRNQINQKITRIVDDGCHSSCGVSELATAAKRLKFLCHSQLNNYILPIERLSRHT